MNFLIEFLRSVARQARERSSLRVALPLEVWPLLAEIARRRGDFNPSKTVEQLVMEEYARMKTKAEGNHATE